ncbi:MAG: F0F1 ATP synthase subunit gamma [Planctomycetota bacterium]
MADERRLQQQIESVDGLRNVIHSMRSLAATYLHRAEAKLDGVRAYTRIVGEGIAACLAGHDIRLPPAEGRRVAVAVFFSEQGLCGRFNDIMAESAAEAADALDDPAFLVIGRRGPGRLDRHGLHVAAAVPGVTNPDDMDGAIHATVRLLLRSHQEGGYREFHLLHAESGGAGEMTARRERILPLDLSPWRDADAETASPPRMELPRRQLLAKFVDEYAFVAILRALAESLAAENGMRLKSMEGAKQNIDDTLEDLRQRARMERQNAITEELLDVVAGTEALQQTP